MNRPVISFLTDYGLGDGFVGVCHGVIARGCPDAQVIDLTHEVPRHDVRAGALLLLASVEFFPDGAVHLAVVDPGVGTARRAVALRPRRARGSWDPTTGCCSPPRTRPAGSSRRSTSVARRVALQPVSATFHGRDMFAPVAAALADGRRCSTVGEAAEPAS